MEELEFIKKERLEIQEKYLKEAKNIWINFEGVEADKKHKKVYNQYKNRDYFLEGLQAKIEDILNDINYYKENKQGDIKMRIEILQLFVKEFGEKADKRFFHLKQYKKIKEGRQTGEEKHISKINGSKNRVS